MGDTRQQDEESQEQPPDLPFLTSQLCKAGAQVLLLNPHYTRYDLDRQEDWTPFEPYLVSDPMK